MSLDRSRGNSQRVAYLGVRAAPAYEIEDLELSRYTKIGYRPPTPIAPD